MPKRFVVENEQNNRKLPIQLKNWNICFVFMKTNLLRITLVLAAIGSEKLKEEKQIEMKTKEEKKNVWIIKIFDASKFCDVKDARMHFLSLNMARPHIHLTATSSIFDSKQKQYSFRRNHIVCILPSLNFVFEKSTAAEKCLSEFRCCLVSLGFYCFKSPWHWSINILFSLYLTTSSSWSTLRLFACHISKWHAIKWIHKIVVRFVFLNLLLFRIRTGFGDDQTRLGLSEAVRLEVTASKCFTTSFSNLPFASCFDAINFL